jgi:hypothetical protein
MAQSLKYLGTAISARRKVRLEAATAKCSEMKIAELPIGIRMNEIILGCEMLSDRRSLQERLVRCLTK